jgi:hypothetical protein
MTVNLEAELARLKPDQRAVVEDLIAALAAGRIDDRRLKFLAMEVQEYLDAERGERRESDR